MTFHATRAGQAAGTARTNKFGHALTPRVTASLSEDEFRRLVELAHKEGKPISAVLRDAVAAYLSFNPAEEDD